jgi:ubiquinol-cytochrome c reductase iron-sulfur subunit
MHSAAERWVAGSLVVSMLASLGLVVVFVFFGNQPQLEGVLLALALGGLGVGIVLWAIRLLDAPVRIEARHELASPPEVRDDAASALELDGITRRSFLVRLLAGAGATLAAALALPALSLGPQPGRALFRTPWSAGARLVDEAGEPIRAGDLAVDSVRTVFPEGHVGSHDAQTLLIRVRPQDLRLAPDRAAWAPDGVVAYSKLCTHAGCPVGLYRAQQQELLCPCHQSTFAVLDGAKPVFGPAARPLPQLPIEVDADGYLAATGDFPEPVGPSFWNLTHTDDAEASVRRARS